jgi:4-hydroxyacetophenone monooxygenase
MDLWLEQLALDYKARGLDWDQRPPQADLEKFKVAVIGAGMGGLNAAVHLKDAGIPFFVIEKNPDVGGTWWENRYPGARVDSTSRTYTHLFGVDFSYPYAFCPRSENLRYFRWIADHFGLRESITFDTEVKSVHWRDDTDDWEITAVGPNGKRVWHANAVISAVGFLSRPRLPTIEGMETFNGQSFHTARWPDPLDLTGKRVAVIGTGATGYQLVPEIAKTAGHVNVFQRTPSWCFDVQGYLSPFPPQVNWLDRNFPYITNFIRLRLSFMAAPQHGCQVMQVDPNYAGDPHARSERNKRMRDERVAFIRSKLSSRPELIDKMIPKNPPMSARFVLVDRDYSIYDALCRDNVSLVSDPIKRVTPNGIELESGAECPVDIIVYATGFKANDFLWPMDVRGRNGKRLETLWEKDGARAYIGTMLPGFPNFFMVYGPNTNNFGGLQIVDFEEMVTKFAIECIGGLISQKRRAVDVKEDAYWRFNAELDRCESFMLYKDPRAHSYYQNAFGRSAANNPIDVRRVWHWLRNPAGRPLQGSVAPTAMEYPCPEQVERIRPFFGEDLELA